MKKSLHELFANIKIFTFTHLKIDKKDIPAILKKPLFIVWFFLHIVVLAVLYHSFLYSLILNLAIMSIALSPVAETLSLYFNNVRRLATSQEKEQLQNIFVDVKSECAWHRDCEIKIVDSIMINAFASPHAIVVTRGLTQVHSTPEELQGIIAHELAHIQNGDASLKSILSMYYNILFITLTAICIVLKILGNLLSGNLIGSLFSFLYSLIRGIYDTLTYVSFIFINLGNRKQEYRADQQACKWGYAEGLKEALYRTYRMEIEDKKKILERIVATHPCTAYRIEKVEAFLNPPT